MVSPRNSQRRRPFLRPLELGGLAALVAGLLFWLFPGADFESPRHLARPDDLSIAYLRMLLRARPDDAMARLLLAQEQLALGRSDEARVSLAPLMARPDDAGTRARIVAVKIDRAQLAALPASDPQRPAIARRVREVAHRLVAVVRGPEDLRELAAIALAFEAPADAAIAYQRLAAADGARGTDWLEQAARAYQAAGQPGVAGRVYAEAALAAPADGARLAVAALGALEAANEGRGALAAVTPLVERFAGDPGVLARAVHVALAAGDLEAARRWGGWRMARDPRSDEALADQVDVLVMAGDPEAAFSLARELVTRDPGNAAWRRKLARIATWSNHPADALQAQAWLARHGSEEARRSALTLARGLHDTDREIEMLELKVARALKARRGQAPVRSASWRLAGGPPPSLAR